MADNVAVTPGAGATIATDDVGGVQYQIVKLAVGGDGVANLASEANPMPSVVAVRNDADGVPLVPDGELSLLMTDEAGRLKVSTKPATYPDITGDITAVQASISVPVAGGTVVGDVSRCSNVMAFCTGTFSAINCTFEGSIESSGDTNWFTVQAIRSSANTIETTTGSLSAQPAYAWELSVNALKRFRVRCTARTSGTQSWRFVQGTYATEPIPGAQISGTQPVSGTVTASGTVGPAAHDAAVSGNPLRIAGRARSTAYTTVADNDTADFIATLQGIQIVRPFQIPELDWSYAAAAGGIINTSDVVIKAAAAAGLRNYLTGILVQNASATIATEVVVKDGATVIWRCYVGTGTLLNSVVGITFPTPLKSTAATALNVACITTASQVYVSAQGYVAA